MLHFSCAHARFVRFVQFSFCMMCYVIQLYLVIVCSIRFFRYLASAFFGFVIWFFVCFFTRVCCGSVFFYLLNFRDGRLKHLCTIVRLTLL